MSETGSGSPTGETCATCAAFEPIETARLDPVGHCRAKPPRVFTEVTYRTNEPGGKAYPHRSFAAKYPLVRRNWWCLEWGPRTKRQAEQVNHAPVIQSPPSPAVPLPAQRVPPSKIVLLDPPNRVYRITDSGLIVTMIQDGPNDALRFQADVPNLYLGRTNPGSYRTDRSRGLFQLGSAPAGPLRIQTTRGATE